MLCAVGLCGVGLGSVLFRDVRLSLVMRREVTRCIVLRREA